MLIVPEEAVAEIDAVSTTVVTSAVASVALPATKFPDESRAIIAEFVFEDVAVVAEFDTFPAVEIVASFVSAMAAEAFMSASTITPDEIAVTPAPVMVTSPEIVVAVTTPVVVVPNRT